MMEMDEVSTTTGGIGTFGTSSMDYEETIALMQAQIDVQKEKINELGATTQELRSQVQKLLVWKESMTAKSGDVKNANVIIKTEVAEDIQQDEPFVLDWKQNASEGLSIADLVKQTAEEVVAKQERQESSSSTTGFVYNEESGWYFDASNGVYYDPRTKLTYSVHDKKYYKYDTETKEYILYPSQSAEQELSKSTFRPRRQDKKTKKNNYPNPNPVLPTTDANTTDEKKSLASSNKHKSKKKMKHKSSNKVVKVKEEPVEIEAIERDIEEEEGEILSSSSKSFSNPVSDEDEVSSCSDSSSTSTIDESDEAKDEEPAPCIRAVVIKSSVTNIKKGTLFIVTCMGGTIGREGTEHVILIPDSNMSKMHASVSYGLNDTPEDDTHILEEYRARRSPCYYILDCGSKNGTFLNGKRIADCKCEIAHGSTLKIGDTTLLLHIHPGQFTCGHCEPGLVIEKEPMYPVAVGPLGSKEKKESMRRKEMKKIRKKFAIEYDASAALSKFPDMYKDRAEARRITKGSDNPFEKTQVTSADEPIKEDNRGYGMMKKMGWKDGVPLGAGGDGIKVPIKFQLKSGRIGLGTAEEFGAQNQEPVPIIIVAPKKKMYRPGRDELLE